MNILFAFAFPLVSPIFFLLKSVSAFFCDCVFPVSKPLDYNVFRNVSQLYSVWLGWSWFSSHIVPCFALVSKTVLKWKSFSYCWTLLAPGQGFPCFSLSKRLGWDSWPKDIPYHRTSHSAMKGVEKGEIPRKLPRNCLRFTLLVGGGEWSCITLGFLLIKVS